MVAILCKCQTTGFFAQTFPVIPSDIIIKSKVPYTDITGIDIETLLNYGNDEADKDMLEVSDKYEFSFDNTGYMIDGRILECQH